MRLLLFPTSSIEWISFYSSFRHLHVCEKNFASSFVLMLSFFLTRDSAILWLFGNCSELNAAFVLTKAKSAGCNSQFKHLR